MAKETDIKQNISVGRCPTLNYVALTEHRERHGGLKAQQSLAWGNALRHEIAGQARNDGSNNKLGITN